MDVILTAPATEMSDHHGKEFLGFATCAPPVVVPRFFLKQFFYPKVKTKRDGSVRFAPYGLRKIEAVLSEEFEVMVVHPYDIENFIEENCVVGISAMDPLGQGPVSVTLASLLGGTPTTKLEFMELLRTVKRHRCRVIVGGAGAWQLLNEDVGVDCVVVGEAEKVALRIFRSAVSGERLPKVVYAEKPDLGDIKVIRGASVNGLVEVSRGCARVCKFCSTAGRKIDIPLHMILEEVRLNLREGCEGVLLHAEDVLMYGSKFLPSEKVLTLFKEVRKLTKNIGISHVSLASVAARPEYVEEITQILETDFIGVQTGVETGSARLLKEYMPAKCYPFSPDEWCDIVEKAFGIMQENNWVPAATIILGLPGENEDDIIATIELLGRLREYPSLIAPLFFVPMHTSALKDSHKFTTSILSELHMELIELCVKHNLRHLDFIMKKYLKGVRGVIVKQAYLGLKKWIERRLESIDWKKLKYDLTYKHQCKR